MKIGITSTGRDLTARVDQRFGRCQYFLILDDNSNDFMVLPNKSAAATGGAGIQAAQTLAKNNVEVLITLDLTRFKHYPPQG